MAPLPSFRRRPESGIATLSTIHCAEFLLARETPWPSPGHRDETEAGTVIAVSAAVPVIAVSAAVPVIAAQAAIQPSGEPMFRAMKENG